MHENVLFRWAIGTQNTVDLANYKNHEDYCDFLWLAKLSVVSFQKHFTGARFVVFYNGNEFDRFCEIFNEIAPVAISPIEFVDQNKLMEASYSPYHFYPRGVWFKWIPFRYDISFNEISVDTDIICINNPTTWKTWLYDSDTKIIVAPERFEKTVVNTCGDLHNHPVLKGKKPLNCGVVGHRIGYDFSEQFYNITQAVRFGETHDSLFITEQGAINLWAYSLANEGFGCHVLDFERNAWVRDFIYYLEKGVTVETVHAVSWHKKIAKGLQEVFERKALDESYSAQEFLKDVLIRAKDFNFVAKQVIGSQFGSFGQDKVEFYFQ